MASQSVKKKGKKKVFDKMYEASKKKSAKY